MEKTKTSFLSRFLYKFKQETTKKIVFLGSIYFLAGWFRTITFVSSTSLFLKSYGPEVFSYANMFLALGGICFMFFSSLFIDSIRKATYFIILHIFILVLWLCMIIFYASPILPAFFYGLSFAMDASFLVQRFNLADETCTVFESKTIYPYLPLYFSVGVMLAGLTISQYSQFFSGYNALVISSGLLLLSIGAATLIRRRFKPTRNNRSEQEKTSPPPLNVILRMILTNRTIWIITAMMIINSFSQYYIDYLLNVEMKKVLSPTQITAFLGTATFIGRILVILLNVFLVRKLLKIMGAIQLGILKPLLSLIALIPFILSPYYITMAGVMIIYQASETAFFVLSRRFSYNMFPKNTTGRLSLIIEGSIAMLGIFFSGVVILLCNIFKITNSYLLAIPLLLLLLVWILLAFKLKIKFFTTLVTNMKGKKKELQYQSIDALIERPYRKEATLEMIKAAKSTPHQDTKERIYFALGKLGDKNVLPFFISILNNPNETDQAKILIYQALPSFQEMLRQTHVTRHNLIEISKNILLQSKNNFLKETIIDSLSQNHFTEIVPLLIQNLESEHLSIRLNSIRALGFFHDIGIIYTLDRFLKKGMPEEQEKCIIALWPFQEQRPFLFPVIAQLMYASEKEKIISGIDLVGTLKLFWEKQYLLDHVRDKDENIQRHAALALTIFEHEEGIPLYLEAISTDHSLQYDALHILNTVSESFRNILFNEIAKLPEANIQHILHLLRTTGSPFYDAMDQLESLLHKNSAGPSERSLLPSSAL